MRSFVALALFGSSFSTVTLQAQTKEQLAEWGPEVRRARPEARHAEAPAKQEQSEPAAPVQPPAQAPAPPPPPPPAFTVAPAPAGPPPRDATAEELASLKIGASEKDMLAVLGPPFSRIVVPDDDGHLRETCQYWAKGSPVATVRLDNGRVVKVDIKR